MELASHPLVPIIDWPSGKLYSNESAKGMLLSAVAVNGFDKRNKLAVITREKIFFIGDLYVPFILFTLICC